MNLALIGYGRMGKEVEAVAKEKGERVAKVLTSKNNVGAIGLTREALSGIDVCIDFSLPAAVLANITAAAEAGKNIVVGTTGWYDKLNEVKKLVKEKKIGLLYATNFSLGVNLFSQMVMEAAHLFDRYPDYDVSIQEIHTAETRQSERDGAFPRLGHSPDAETEIEILHETSAEGQRRTSCMYHQQKNRSCSGRHTVMFDSDSDTIN
jgi:4-hydroxy-tetrahydrodipicolinate reductase